MSQNRKKILIYGLSVSFIAIIFFVLPAKPALAAWYDPRDWIGSALSWISWNSLGVIFIKLPACFMAICAWVIEILAWLIFTIVTWTVERLFEPDFYLDTVGGFSSNAVVIQGWKLVSGVANLIYIIILLFIGVGTLFRVEKYNYKNLLIKLIVAALLTNFSLLFAGIILDFVHVIMFSSIFGHPLRSLADSIRNLLWTQFVDSPKYFIKILAAKDTQEVMSIVAAVTMGAIFIVVASIVISFIAFFLIVRIVALWILLVLSPFAYVFMVLPDTQGIANKWWSSFLQYAFLGPLLVFFVWFSSTMLVSINAGITSMQNPTDQTYKDIAKWTQGATGDSPGIEGSNAGNLINEGTWLYMAFVTIMLVASLFAAASLGTVGAGAAIGMAKIAATGVGALASFGAVRGAMSAARWGFGSAREKRAERKIRGLESKIADTKDPTKKEEYQKEIDRHKATADNAKKWSSYIGMAAAVTSPLALYRAAKLKYEEKSKTVASEDREAILESVGWIKNKVIGEEKNKGEDVSRFVKADRVNKRKAIEEDSYTKTNEANEAHQESLSKQQEAQSLADRENALRGEAAKAGSEKEKEEITKLADEIAGKRKQVESTANSKRQESEKLHEEADKLLRSVMKGSGSDLDESRDQEFIKAATNSITSRIRKKIFERERVEALGVQEELEKMQDLNDSGAVIAELFGASTANRKEAALIKLAQQNDINDACRAFGKSTDDTKGLLSGMFNEQRAVRVGIKLSQIAGKNGTLNYTKISHYDPSIGKTVLTSKEQQAEFIKSIYEGMTFRGLGEKLRPEDVLDLKPDGTAELSLKLKTLLDVVKDDFEGFISTVSRYRKQGKTVKAFNVALNLIDSGKDNIGLSKNQVDMVRKIVTSTQAAQKKKTNEEAE